MTPGPMIDAIARWLGLLAYALMALLLRSWPLRAPYHGSTETK